MSAFWNWYIIILVVANIAGCLWLLFATSRSRPGEQAAGETTGHVWDEDLREYNNPLPRWWLNLFYITVVFGVIYLVLYPGLGRYKCVLGWTEVGQYQAEVAAADKKYGGIFAAYKDQDIAAMSKDPKVLAMGAHLFSNNCAMCHGSDARGAPGFPNLTDNDWLYGGEPKTIEQTILHGRQGAMPTWGPVLGKAKVKEVATYVRQLAGYDVPKDVAANGKTIFSTYCAACHGPNGKGNQALGAPNLTDDIWLYGGSLDTIVETVTKGRSGHMPAQIDNLGPDKIHVLAAYVYSLSHRDGGESAR
jgi:cytochrome c oxidase cbb3-type subunit 3